MKYVIRNCTVLSLLLLNAKELDYGRFSSSCVTPCRPFRISSVDFTSHFETKCINHRITKLKKSYAAIFTYFTTRAVHLEPVFTLFSEDFLNSLHRDQARFTLVKETNFIGTSNYLDLQSLLIQSFATHDGVMWSFNPPRSSYYEVCGRRQ